jgi:hypothetical protein
MEHQDGQPLPGHAPAMAQSAQAKPNFQTAGYSTPHQRAIDDPRVPQAIKQALDAEHAALDPVRLLSGIRTV